MAWVRRSGNLLCALVVALAMMLLLGAGYGPVPALGRALAPAGGVWDSAGADPTAHDETLDLSGLSRPAKVTFSRDGYAAVDAASDRDLFVVQGYVTARFRIAQMDLARRLGSGRLSELNGPAQLESDRFELRLGLLRSARAEWAAYEPGSTVHEALTAYAEGVNAWLQRLGETGEWPVIYGLTGVRPQRWTPVDSLVVQKVFTQQMDFSTAPLTYELLRGSLGQKRTAEWFPHHAPTPQQPYDPGPYRTLPLDPVPTPDANAAAPTAAAAPASPEPAASPSATAQAAGQLLAELGQLPYAGRQERFNSNAWAVNGPAAGGGSMLAGDPHIGVSLPSSWFQITLRSPGYRVSGGSLPGAPGVVLGRNEHLSWSLTNASSQGTFYYKEKTSADRPGAYYWKGAWRQMEKVHYTIPVRGADPVGLDVDLTVHGPVMTMKKQTLAVTWMGNRRSDDLGAILRVNRARNHTEFRAALRNWRAPAMNFVYADDKGGIAAISPGTYPQFPAGTEPWRAMSGTGDDEMTGTIPFDAVPQVRNPPGHVISSTNQRQVGEDYPYYLGTAGYFDPGHRQSVILDRLGEDGTLTPADFAALQNDVTDELAARLVPALLAALDKDGLNARQRAARDLLAAWDHTMDVGSPAASIWWTFLSGYLSDVFGPWWDAQDVPADEDRSLDLTSLPIPLREALEHWTLHDPDNEAFTPPGEVRRDAPAVMRSAFGRAVDDLADRFGPRPATWTWGKLHSREIVAITGAPGLGYGPYADGGDPWTVNAAGGDLTSDFGPSWRMIVRWTGPGRGSATAVYPGGQSENPASPWYTNLVARWRDGRALPLPDPSGRSALDGAAWTVRPGG
ncbi:penicillin acylase family protein [Streptomyces caelestis]|uniref:penicillin acylase family protein n=1 Tax=Streptomyces caelestis TaxID=36816 RepID=UPI0037F4B7F1